jgi:simple sugar transport system ATP-binding protein
MTPVAAPAVELRGVTKQFGPVLANVGVNLRVEAGTIHGVIGENGAGKTTAMNLLYGMLAPDAGEILVRGKECEWRSPADAIANGIGMVHQHFMLAGPYSALDNILLGAEPVQWGLIERRSARVKVESLASQYGLVVDLTRPIEQLPVGIQQRVEILKLLYREANILILDEPTAVLTPLETNTLFENLRRLRQEGKTVLLVTHKLKEVMAVTDHVTVFRGGKVIADMPTASATPQELANLMVGRKVSLSVAVPAARPGKELALEVSRLTLPRGVGSIAKLSEVSFSVRHGEIVGIAGVEGNGQSELVQALLHPRESSAGGHGQIRMLDQNVTNWEAHRIRALGVAVIPEDRLQEGLLAESSLSENFLLGQQRASRFQRAGFVRSQELELAAQQALEEYDVRPRRLELAVGKLSGGNQQKLVIAREFSRKPQLIIAAQPTRGVDVGAIEFIHGRLLQARDQGAGVLLISSELDEILELSDRVLVMYEGRIVAEFARGQATEGELGLRMGGLASDGWPGQAGTDSGTEAVGR